LKSVLLVEDNVEVAELFVCLLGLAGCAVTAIRCGSKLPADLAQFDALMTDLTLPATGPNGMKVAEMFRKTNPDAMIIMVTGKCKSEIHKPSPHVDVLMHKPVDAERIIKFFSSL
jgi:CheY-like chemotaxis protein